MHRSLWFSLLVLACAHTPTRKAPCAQISRVAQGTRALGHGDLDLAEAQFSMALEYDAQTKEALNGLGLVSMVRGDHATARRLFQAALVYDDDFAEAHANCGALELAQARPDRALPHLRSALSIDPGDTTARQNFARALATLGLLAEAQSEYVKLTSSVPDNAEAWAELARVELSLGHRTAAGRATNLALALAPSQPIAQRVYADLTRP